jgi:hypothetical protein
MRSECAKKEQLKRARQSWQSPGEKEGRKRLVQHKRRY